MNVDDSSSDLDHQYVPECSVENWLGLSHNDIQSNLSFLSVNIRSLTGKFGELVAHLNVVAKNFTFILVSETWLKDDTDFGFNIPGYKSVSLNRKGDQLGGGLKLYYDECLNVTILNNLTGNDGPCERLFVRSYVPGVGNIVVGGIYRPPDKSKSEFCQFLDGALEELGGGKSVLLGDFNINIINDSDSQVQNYSNVFLRYHFVNEINVPTYNSPITHVDTSCIDHIWHNLDYVRKSYVVKPNLSDHYAVCACFSKNIDREPVKIRFRDFSARSVENFISNLDGEFSTFSPPNTGANEYAIHLVNFLTRLNNKYFQIRTKFLSKKRLRSPWVTSSIIQCIKKKHRWYRLMKNNIITRRSYEKCCKSLRNILRMAEESFHVHRFKSLGNDSKRNWRILNSLLGNLQNSISNYFTIGNEKVYDETIICEEFGRYFIENPKKIHNEVPPCNTSFLDRIPVSNASMSFHPVTPSEIKIYIKKLKKNGRIDDLSKRFLVLCIDHVSPYISTLFNLCVNQGTFPDIFKLAKITPVFKKGKRDLVTNYRPISVLSNLSKLFESVIHSRVQTFFENTNLLSNNQFGYRKNLNTELALFNLISKIIPAVDNRKYAACIFLDYSSCFDTISRGILFQKLERYGINGTCLELLRSYLTDRNQTVLYNNFRSTILNQELGVVQGSKLGPGLYDVYSNDFNFLCNDDECVLYADDTALVYVGNDFETLIEQVNEKLELVTEWCNSNKLKLNASKSEIMIVSNREFEGNPDVLVAGNPIGYTDHFKYLGVHIDAKLKFKFHIDELKTRLNRLCGISYRLKNHFNLQTARMMYYSCVYSVATYCIAVWVAYLSASAEVKFYVSCRNAF